MATDHPAGAGNNAFSITPADGSDITRPAYLNVAVAGTVRVTPEEMTDGSSVDIYVAAGIVFPLLVKRVWSTGTTATGIVGVVR